MFEGWEKDEMAMNYRSYMGSQNTRNYLSSLQNEGALSQFYRTSGSVQGASGWFQRVIFGVDLDAEQERGEELDRRLEELNREKLESGDWDEETFEQAEANRKAGIIDIREEVYGEFTDELKARASELGMASAGVGAGVLALAGVALLGLVVLKN